VFGAWWDVVSRALPDRSAGDALLHSWILYFSQITALSLLLGWTGQLTRAALLASNILWSAALLIVARRRFPAPSRSFTRFRRLRIPIGTGLVAACNVTLTILSVLLVALVILRGARAGPSTYDELAYHLPMVALMRQRHNLALASSNFIIDGYPKNVELWFHWILTCFGSDRWVDIAQLPFLLLGMNAVYCLARRTGSTWSASAAGALLLPFAPVVIAQVTTAYTDVAVSALLLAAIALLAIMHAECVAISVMTFSCATGLLLGTKYSGVNFAAILLIPAAVLIVRRSATRRQGAIAVALGLGTVFALGGSTYVWNWLTHANPVFPYRLSLGTVTWPGPWDSTKVYGAAEAQQFSLLTRLWYSWGAVEVAKHSTLFGGFGFTWPLLLGLTVISVALAIRSMEIRRIALVVLVVVVFAATPLNFRVRFTIYLLGLGCVAFAHVLDETARAPRGHVMLIAAVIWVASYSLYQVWPERFAPLFGPHAHRHATLARCPKSVVAPFGRAYRWVRAHAADGSLVYTFRGSHPQFLYCLWNRSLSNRVKIADPVNEVAFLDLLNAPTPVIVFMPHDTRAYRFYRRHADRFVEGFVDGDATVAVAR